MYFYDENYYNLLVFGISFSNVESQLSLSSYSKMLEVLAIDC